MFSFEKPLGLPFDGAFVQDSPLSWISRNNSKPGRSVNFESWVLHASPDWSDRCIDAEADTILAKLIDAFWQAIGIGSKPKEASYAAAHRWRYAIPLEPLEMRCLFNPELKIGACGDWCGGPRVEGAFLSGVVMAGCVLDHMSALR